MLALISSLILCASVPELTAEANSLRAAGRIHEARLKMEQAFVLAPAELPVLLALARLREDDGDYAGAIEALDSYLALESRGPEVAEANKHVARLRGRIRPIPEAAREANNRAAALLRLGRTADGVNALLEAELLAPHWPDVLSWLATYYEQNGRPDEALPRLRRLMAIATDSELARLQERAAEQQIRIDDLARAAKASEDALAAERQRQARDAAAQAAQREAEQKARELAQQRAAEEAKRRAELDAAETEGLRIALAVKAREQAEQSRTTARTAGIVIAGVGVAVLVSFAVFEGLALDAEGKVKNGGLANTAEIYSTVKTHNTMSSLALITGIAGGAAVVGGGLLALFNRGSAPPPVSVGVLRDGAMVSIGGSFP